MKKRNNHFILYFFLCTIAVYFPGCTHRKHVDRQKLFVCPMPSKKINCSTKPPVITIWVHGTLMFRKPNYHLIFANKSCLAAVISLPVNNHFRTLAAALAQEDPQQFPLSHFYVFSWSGRLQNSERKQAAHTLHREIITVIEEYKATYGIDPVIQIIAHSHGGNVVLNMAKIQKPYNQFTIDKLILLACPVQEKTMHLINNSLFSRVYSLYSSFDIIQVLAPQFRRKPSFNERNSKRKPYRIPPFSSRIFPSYERLTQTKIKINNYPVSHTRFSTQEFIILLPVILQKLDLWHQESLSSKSSQHKLLCIFNKKLD